MVVLESYLKHNMVAYLEKTDGNAEFQEIIDFLTRSSIHYALIVIAGKPVTVSEASIPSDLRFNDVDGIDSLNNQAIFDAIKLMGYEGDVTVLTFNKAMFSPQWKFLFHTLNHCLSSKSTSWDQIPTNIATAVICLTSNQKFNFSKLIFDEDEGEGSERPSEPQPTPSPPHPSEAHVEPQSDPSPGPSPTIPIPDPIPEGSGGNLGSQSSSDKSLSGKNNIFEGTSQEVEKASQAFHFLHHKAWLRDISEKEHHKKSVFTTNTEWVNLDMDINDTMNYILAQDEGKMIKCEKEKYDKFEEGTAEPTKRKYFFNSSNNSNTFTQQPLGDDENNCSSSLYLESSQAVSKKKEIGIDPKLKAKNRIEEDEESDMISEEKLLKAKRSMIRLTLDEGLLEIQETRAEEERKRLTEEEATKTALSNEYEIIQARIEADRLLAKRVQEAEREQCTVEERAKFLYDTIATQRRILAQQRTKVIRNKPPTKNQFRNQMMTYLKYVGNKKHAGLKTKSFDEIKALYEKVKRFDDSFITIGSTEDERKIKDINEGASDPDKKKKFVKEDVSTKVPAKQDVSEQGTKKRKGGHIKMIARKRKRPQPDVDSDDEHRKCLKIVTFEGTIDSEIMERKLFISKLDKVSSPEGDYLVVYRVNGNFRAFNYLMEVLHIFDRQDLFHLYDLVMKQYSESTPEGIELILWGDLKIMMESSIEVTDQEFKDGTVIHMLVERKYPLSKELLQRMLDFGLEVEVESTAALDLIRRIAKDVKETLRSDQDLSECLNTSSMEFKESTPKKHEVKQVQQSCLGEDCWELYIPDLVPLVIYLVPLVISMAVLAITISSDASEESLTSVVSRVILFGTIPTEIPIVSDMLTDLPTVPELPAVSPFLGLDDSESESVDESPERHVSLRLHDNMVSKWRDWVRFCSSSPSRSSSPDTTIPSTEIATASPACISTSVIIASLTVYSRIRATARKSTLGLRPVMMPARSAAFPLTSSSSIRPSRKRSRSLATSISSIVRTAGVLSPSRVDLLPPRKRYRVTSVMHLDESGDEATAIIDGLGNEPVLARVKAGFELGLAIVETESELEEAEADEEADVEVQIMTITRSGMTPEAIEELISRRVEEALAAQEANRNAGLIDENQSQNRDDNDNGSGGNGNHGNNNGDGNPNGGNEGAKRDAPVARTIGIDEAYEMPWKDLMKLMIEVMVPEENGKSKRNDVQKRKFDNNLQGNRIQQPPFKRHNVAQDVMVVNNEKRGYTGSAPYCNKCRLHHEGPCTGYFKSECLKLKNQNHGNKAASNDARGRAYALGGGDGNPDSNVMTGTFLLNNHYAYILFDSGADRSFVSTKFSTLIDIPPTVLDVSYAV
ncbi:hypothetical protein Tco_0443520 [Tanacetum coccineum]